MDQGKLMDGWTPDALSRLIGGCRVDLSTEAAAQRGLADLFRSHAVPFRAEVRLSDEDRIDFLVGTVGIEVKIGQSRRAILRQLDRYAQSPDIAALLLVSSTAFPSSGLDLRGKPVSVVSLSMGWL